MVMAVRTDNCATGFSKNFAEKSFLFKSRVRKEWYIILTVARPLQVILIKLHLSGPWGMSVRTAELQYAISISAMRASGP